MSQGSVLLVDDDDLVLQSLTFALEDEGYQVQTAASGEDALALCKGDRITSFGPVQARLFSFVETARGSDSPMCYAAFPGCTVVANPQ